jgi:8-oxo-dGTP pyrophosphatase MutT (NUDIX family)
MAKKTTQHKRFAACADAMARGSPIEQVGALCVRVDGFGAPEVLLITTRGTGRWTIPKGWPIKGLKPHEAAEREAWEEAGVRGKAQKKPVGCFTYLKFLDNDQSVPAKVDVYLLAPKSVSEDFPERDQRVVQWVSPDEAAVRVEEPELRQLLVGLTARSAA